MKGLKQKGKPCEALDLCRVKMRPPSTVSRPTSTVQVTTSRKPTASPSRPVSTRPNSIPLRPKSEANVKLGGTASKPQTPCKPPSSRSSHSLTQQVVASSEKRIQLMDKKLSILHSYASHNGDGFEAMAALFGHLNKAVSL